MVLVPAADGAPPGNRPVVVVLLAGRRVDLRAVSQHLQCGGGRLRLATPAEAVAATGCELGCIPPVGHAQELQTLVDAHIAARSPDQLLCAGAGMPGTQMLLSVAELLSASADQVGSFSTQQQQQQLAPQQQQQQQVEQQQQPEQSEQDTESGQQLPEPWPAGAELVQLVGVLAQRRR
jgi:prolyl-tRNA editing enzyme YbaK/EbsC (Cys-tRNA(Pro) deacylase)